MEAQQNVSRADSASTYFRCRNQAGGGGGHGHDGSFQVCMNKQFKNLFGVMRPAGTQHTVEALPPRLRYPVPFEHDATPHQCSRANATLEPRGPNPSCGDRASTRLRHTRGPSTTHLCARLLLVKASSFAPRDPFARVSEQESGSCPVYVGKKLRQGYRKQAPARPGCMHFVFFSSWDPANGWQPSANRGAPEAVKCRSGAGKLIISRASNSSVHLM